MDQGTCWHPREEAADAEAKSESAEVGPTQPHEYVTVAWARGRKWREAKTSDEWVTPLVLGKGGYQGANRRPTGSRPMQVLRGRGHTRG